MSTIQALTKKPTKISDAQIIISCMIGNALEWYDFVIYGYFAVIFGKFFFPQFDPLTQTLASWGVFWAGFLIRPIGSIVFGYLGDKIGRKFALTLSIYFMAIPTTLIGFLPTYEQVGILAPILLILLRACQGFAMGGEYSGAVIFLTEHAKPGHRGQWASWANFSVVVGVIIGSLVVTGFSSFLSAEAMDSWGWRLPFIVSIVGGLVGGYIRQKLTDPHVFLEIKEIKERTHTPISPLKTLFLQHKAKLGLIILLDFLTAFGFYITTIFLASYFKTYLHFEASKVFLINTGNMFIMALCIYIGGFLADRIGRRRVLGYACLGVISLSYPLFVLVQTGSYHTLFSMQATLAVLIGLFLGAIPISLAEIMPMSVRYSGVSIGHNVSMSIFGGGTPFLATELIHATGNIAAPSFLLITGAILSLIAVFFITTDRS